MKIPYITVEYDKYWHQLVIGYAIYKLGQGLIYWQRLFGIGKAKHLDHEM